MRLRAREALSVLRLRVGDERYDEENLARAIVIIERGGERPLLPG